MVNGLHTPAPLMAVDLDGTLLRGNSLHVYIGCGLRCAPLHRRALIVWALLLRRLRLCPHLTMKRRVLRLIEPTARVRACFQARTAQMRRAEVDAIVADHVSRGGKAVLATAAPETYVPWLWQGDALCTDALAEKECRGEEKLRRVLEYAAAHGARFDVVVTDHPDDRPLLDYPGIRRITVGPRLAGIECERHIE